MLRKDHNNAILSAYGLCFSMLELLSQTLGFKYRLVEVPDNGFGALQEDGSWDGMVGMVLRKVRRS
ncbi:Glutamate receptor U1 [Portunus trituberculatus]|uniref:Glutamate receptor U1 n=1 Tax=Portunus trituberculatus TaxID=210409 RepID=A0A5B7FVK1_PORTR|nr:Glutamate receptor U1 [Portunus trituberculatus]